MFDCCRICPSIFGWCNISLFLSFCLLFSLVPTCSRLKIPNHQPSQQSLSSRASHPGVLYSRSVSDMVLQAFGFHPSGKGTRLITLGALYRQTPVSGNSGQESDVPGLGLSVPWCRCSGFISYSHLQTQLDTSAFTVFAVFITNDLGSEFHTGSIYFQTPQQCFLGEGNLFLCSPAPCFICCVVKFVSVSRLNCCKYKSPDTNGFVADRCSFSLLFEIIPSESHCYLYYWHRL